MLHASALWSLLAFFVQVFTTAHAAEPVRAARPGLPLPRLSDAQVAEYDVGFAAFRRHVFAPEGLGPAFNGGDRCYHCYSDLLLHDIGTGDGIAQGDAGGNEFRTAPLWVMRSAAPFLHDGRAHTLTEAILAHEGEALPVRDAYLALSPSQQNAVQRFLKTR
jgi:di-heme oxidoreductase (putative peroxidase)